MLRRLSELGGVLLANTIVGVVLQLVPSGSKMTLQSWVVTGIIPLALLLIYWWVLEPRQRKARIREARYQRAIEDALERDYKLDPDHNISPEGLMFEGASDPYRKRRYEDLGILDLFVPDPRKGQTILKAKADEGAEMLARAQRDGLTPELLGELREWERLSGEDVAFYQRGPLRKGQAAGFTKHSFTKEPDEQPQLRRISQEVRELRLYVEDQAKLARQRAERIDGF